MLDSAVGRPPIVAPGISIGIVGHRTDRIADDARVREAILGLIAEMKSSFSEEAVPKLRLVTALAEGADRIGAEAAREAGLAIDAVLPFPPEEYCADFETVQSREAFDALLEAADSVLTLDGAVKDRARAYDSAGLALLDNCDLLIAVWDGGPGRGRGGTRDVIDEALRRALPILTVSPDGRSTVLRIPKSTPRPTVHLEDVPCRDVDELPDLIREIVRLFDEGEPNWLSVSAPPTHGLMYAAYPALLKVAGVSSQRKRGENLQSEAPHTKSTLQTSFDWWDAAANGAAKAFRSAVIVNFSLAALAVVLASVSLLLGDAKWVLVAAEIAVICLLIANTWYASKQKWQERWLESREVAELLRVSILLRHVGIGRGVADSPTAPWSTRYVAAIARSVPPESIDLSHPALVAEGVVSEIASQADWNEANGRRMRLVAHRVGRFGEVLFAAVLILLVVWLALWFSEPHLAQASKYWLTALTAGLPAIASASYGIRIILDFEGAAQRASHLSDALRAALANWSRSSRDAASLQMVAVQSSEAMMGDVGSWRLLAEGRRLAVPG